MAKAPPTPAPETFQDLSFPLNGLNTQTEFELQPPQTTRSCLNVRAYEPITMRLRGGSRPGLSEYIPAQVAGIAAVIQHLNIVADPSEPNLLTFYDNNLFGETSGGTMDPSSNNPLVGGADGYRNPDRWTRTGGSGATQNRHVGYTGAPVPPYPPPPPPPPHAPGQLVVATFVSGTGAGPYTLLVAGAGGTITAYPAEGVDTETIGTACYAVLTGSNWYFTPFLFRSQ
jgi:hypothetical protein